MSILEPSSADIGTPVSVKIRERITAARRRFHANDNIAEYIEPGELEDEGQKYWNRVDRPHEYFTVQQVFEQAYRFPTATAEAIAAEINKRM